MLSKNKIKFIHSLDTKKARKEENAFLVEGFKSVDEFLPSFHCKLMVATSSYFSTHPKCNADEIIEVTPEELSRASLLKTPQEVLAVFEQPFYKLDFEAPSRSLCLALDGVQDPGNLGTIIRIADWFGIDAVYASEDTVDVFNPKVVQATMGAIFRVKFHYADIPALCSSALKAGGRVYGTFLDGENMYGKELSNGTEALSVIVIGNEANGISANTSACVTDRLYIPPYPANDPGSESLNAAVATAITVAEFRRQNCRKR